MELIPKQRLVYFKMVNDFFRTLFIDCVMHFSSTNRIPFCFSNKLIKKIDQNESINQNGLSLTWKPASHKHQRKHFETIDHFKITN